LASSGERRTRLVSLEHELGDWTRAIRPPDPRLQPLLARGLIGYRHSRAGFDSWLEPPRPELTLMIDLDGAIQANGAALPDAWIGGLTDTYTVVSVSETYGALDLKLTPLGAFSLLGFPLSELAGATVSLDDVFGPAGAELAARLRELDDWDERFDLVQRFLLQRLAVGPTPDPAVAWAWRRLRETAGQVHVCALAGEVGCSRRYLSARFREQTGLAPKTIARLMRFQRVRAGIERDPPGWADRARGGLLRPTAPEPRVSRAGGNDAVGVPRPPNAGRRGRRGRVRRGGRRLAALPFLQDSAPPRI